MRRFLFLVSLFISFQGLHAQDSAVVRFTYSKKRINADSVALEIKVSAKPGIRVYAVNQPSVESIASSIEFDSSVKMYMLSPLEEKAVLAVENDESTGLVSNYFTDSAVWKQTVSVKEADSAVIKGTINFLYRNAEEYIPGEEKFKFFINPAAKETTSSEGSVENKSLLWIFFIGFLSGLGALLTPCVFSMIPVTVSFFTKRSKTKAEGKRNALVYSVSIISIFTFVGFLITLIWGATALNNLATNWIANLIFFALFLVFGFSFLGAFEITLPSSWTNKADTKAGMGSFAGIFFMALVLVLVSFSCTGPFIGNLLPIIGKGGYFGPLVGFFSFSLALSLPFSLFAFFPSMLNALAKPGGWMNAVKVTMGFIELALALKFLSNADLVKGWRILDREVFIVLWVVIFFLLGLYLLGKLKLRHDDELPANDFGLPHLSVTRLMFAITAFAFSLYMIPGLWGAPLKSISAFVPPMGTQDFVSAAPGSVVKSESTVEGDLHPVKYYEQMKMYEPEVVTKYGMITFYDYDEALAAARKQKKPLMLDFTGINCVNCRKMEGQVWSDPEIMKLLKEEFVIVSLYVDVQNIDLQESEQYFSTVLNKKIETLGDKNADLQVTKYSANSQPYYFFLDANENRLSADGYGYDPDVKKFKLLLEEVLRKYKSGN